jgi:hypothetical protein
MDQVIKEKFNQEQFATLNDFRNLIYETEKKKKDGPTPPSQSGCGTGGCGGTGKGGCH